MVCIYNIAPTTQVRTISISARPSLLYINILNNFKPHNKFDYHHINEFKLEVDNLFCSARCFDYIRMWTKES